MAFTPCALGLELPAPGPCLQGGGRQVNPFGGAVKPLRRGKERGGPLCFRGAQRKRFVLPRRLFPWLASRRFASSARARPRLLYQIMFEMRAVRSRHLSSFVFLRRFAGLLFFAALRRIHLDASPRTLRPCFYLGLCCFLASRTNGVTSGTNGVRPALLIFFRDEAASRRASRRRTQHLARAAPRRGRSTSRASTAGHLNGLGPPAADSSRSFFRRVAGAARGARAKGQRARRKTSQKKPVDCALMKAHKSRCSELADLKLWTRRRRRTAQSSRCAGMPQ